MKNWLLGFLAGSVLASYVALSCADAHGQSPEVSDAIHSAAVWHGVSEGWLLRTAWCESRYSPLARGRAGERGLFQFQARTWAWMSRQAGYAGASPDDPYAAAMVTGWAFAHRLSSHWSCA
jgi:soluble lytic murein transglycosylase-like protein